MRTINSEAQIQLEGLAPEYNWNYAHGGCELAEYYYLVWLATSLSTNSSIEVQDVDVVYASRTPPRQRVSHARVLQKSYRGSSATSLILTADVPELEGMIVEETSNFVRRPFCQFARYRVYRYGAEYDSGLDIALRPEGLSLNPDTDALTVLCELLSRHNHDLGSQFVDNVQLYSQVLYQEGIVATLWNYDPLFNPENPLMPVIA